MLKIKYSRMPFFFITLENIEIIVTNNGASSNKRELRKNTVSKIVFIYKKYYKINSYKLINLFFILKLKNGTRPENL